MYIYTYVVLMYTHTQCSHYVNYKSSYDNIYSICIVLIDTYIHMYIIMHTIVIYVASYFNYICHVYEQQILLQLYILCTRTTNFIIIMSFVYLNNKFYYNYIYIVYANNKFYYLLYNKFCYNYVFCVYEQQILL